MNNIEEYAQKIATRFLGNSPARIHQFPTGLSHFVFEVSTDDQSTYVIRIARPERSQEFQLGHYWHEHISKLAVPLPIIYEVGQIEGFHFAVYQRLPGNDLENVYTTLSDSEKKRIALDVNDIQQKIATLDASLFEKISPWKEILQGIISRSEKEIRTHGLCNPQYADLVRREFDDNWRTLESFRPSAFLYDLNVRNVLVQQGTVSGIIDVDEMWFGDPLLAIGRGKIILLAMQLDTIFIEYWCEQQALSSEALRRVDLYALLYCLRFMGTIGTKLNGNVSIQTNPDNAQLFESLAERFLSRLE